jgi:hypothetical protein
MRSNGAQAAPRACGARYRSAVEDGRCSVDSYSVLEARYDMGERCRSEMSPICHQFGPPIGALLYQISSQPVPTLNLRCAVPDLRSDATKQNKNKQNHDDEP